MKKTDNWDVNQARRAYREKTDNWDVNQARQACRALKSLVKVQALFRGYLVRKRTAATLTSIRALKRAQAYSHAHKNCAVEYAIQMKDSKQGLRSRSSRALTSERPGPQVLSRLSLHDSQNSKHYTRRPTGVRNCPRYMASTESSRAKLKYRVEL